MPAHDVIPDSAQSRTVERLVSGGEGLVRTDGGVVFVPDVLPGEVVRLGELERRGGALRAPRREIVSASPDRVSPRCRHVGACGGCDWQHMSHAAQLGAKRAIVVETIRRIARLEIEPPAIHTAGPWGTRSRTVLHGDGRRIGYRARHSHEIVVPTECPVLERPLADAVLEWTVAGDTARERVLFSASDGGIVDSLRPVVATISVGTTRIAFNSGSFMQANRTLLPKLGDALAGLVDGGTVVDLFAGSGLLATLLVAGARTPPTRVAIVERDRRNGELARTNIATHAACDVAIVARDVTRVDLGRLLSVSVPDRPLTVVVDPPRSGLPVSVRRALVAARPDRIVYLSCDVATLARDLADLCARSDSPPVRDDVASAEPVAIDRPFRLVSTVLFDFFPQTSHVETLCLMEPAS